MQCGSTAVFSVFNHSDSYSMARIFFLPTLIFQMHFHIDLSQHSAFYLAWWKILYFFQLALNNLKNTGTCIWSPIWLGPHFLFSSSLLNVLNNARFRMQFEMPWCWSWVPGWKPNVYYCFLILSFLSIFNGWLNITVSLNTKAPWAFF